jgi:hypothetical protein
MARSAKQPGDFTGRQTEQKALEHQEELARRQQEISTTQRIEAQRDESIGIDYSDPDRPKEVPLTQATLLDDPHGVVEEEVGGLNEPMRWVKVLDTFTCTIGYGRKYEFEAGRRYHLPVHVCEHLDEKGYIA